jgi:hypothetical protein
MKIEVLSPNKDSTVSMWVYEIDPSCERVLVMGGKVWGFTKEHRQIDGVLISYDPRVVLRA